MDKSEKRLQISYWNHNVLESIVNHFQFAVLQHKKRLVIVQNKVKSESPRSLDNVRLNDLGDIQISLILFNRR